MARIQIPDLLEHQTGTEARRVGGDRGPQAPRPL